MYFRAVLCGSLLFAVVLATRFQLLIHWPSYATLDAQLRDFLKPLAKDPASASAAAEFAVVCFAAMLAGWPAAALLNLPFRKNRSLRRAIKDDDFESILYSALEEECPLLVSMSDGKVYVGFVVSTFDPTTTRKAFSLLPLMSGYRDRETRKVTFTTFYTEIYGAEALEQMDHLAAPLEHLNPADFVTVFPVDCVVSCHRFDFDAYEAFNKSPPSSPAPSLADEASAKDRDLDLSSG